MGRQRLPRLIKTALKKTLWPVLTKPWETPDMEFHYGLWNGVSALYCDSGRQLGEENTRPFALNHHIAAETIACKYAGSRMGRDINMSALRTAMQNFDAAAAITLAVRDYHLGRLPASHRVGIWDLYILARASIALVAYQKRFARQAETSPKVSDALTSQYQFISGVFMICRHMMEHGDPAIAGNDPIGAEALYDYADAHGIFISFNGMACAGSTKKIHEFLELCEVGGAAKQPCDLGAIVSAPDNWYLYALATVELDCFAERHRTLCEAADSNASAEIYEGLGDYVRALMGELPEPGDAPFENGVLLRQNRILSLLGRPQIKAIPSKHFAARI